ncbi:MAG: hypothetical protein KJ645_13350 [Planctomycetes bacterium]|nr:hypothetical protein [Planctomycetota bacterium]
MTDYQLTAGQQQQLIDFLNNGKSIYVEGGDFGYYHGSSAVYAMFGCNFLGDSDTVLSLTGQRYTIQDQVTLNYYNAQYTNDYTDWISAKTGATILFKSEENKDRVVAYAGPNGTYRAIHCTFVFGAMKNDGASHTKAQIMAAYMRYLKGDDFVLGATEDISAATGGQVCMCLEPPASEANRLYGVLGTGSGTDPGFQWAFAHFPLNYDVFMEMVIAYWNTPYLDRFMGNLNAQGRSAAIFNTLGPLDSMLVGVQMHFGYVLANPINYASMPIEVNIVP